MNKFNVYIITIMLLTIPTVSASYTTEEIEFIILPNGNYIDSNNYHNFTSEMPGRLINTTTPYTYINISYNTIGTYFYFTKSYIMDGIFNLTLQLPFPKETYPDEIVIYTMNYITTDKTKMSLWYKSNDYLYYSDDNRSYASLPFVYIQPYKFYYIQFNFTSGNNQTYLTYNDVSEKQINKIYIDDVEYNGSLDYKILVTQFLSGTYAVFDLKPEQFFSGYYSILNITVNYDLPDDDGKIYAYMEALPYGYTYIKTKIIYKENGTWAYQNINVYNYSFNYLAYSDNLSSIFSFKFYGELGSGAYIPFKIDNTLNEITITTGSSSYTYFSHSKSTSTLLYTQDAITYYPDNDNTSGVTKSISESLIEFGIKAIETWLTLNPVLQYGISAISGSVDYVYSQIVNYYYQIEQTVYTYMNNLKWLSNFNITPVLKEYNQKVKITFVKIQEQLYNLINILVPFVITLVYAPLLVIYYRLIKFIIYLYNNNLTKASEYKNFNFMR